MSLVQTTKKANEYLFTKSVFPKEADNIYMRCAAAVYVRKVEKAIVLKNLLAKRISIPILEEKLPFCVPAKDPAYVWIYPNMPRLTPKCPNVTYLLGYKTSLQPLFDRYKADLEDVKKAIKWKTQATGVKFVIKRERMLYSRLFSRFLGLTETLKDDEIRNIAQWVQSEYEEPVVFFCNQPEDYFHMFRVPSPGSCMVNRENEGGGNYHGPSAGKFWDELKKQRMFPSVWYHYNPFIQGVYLAKNGQPVARCFLIFNEKDECQGYTPCYSRFSTDGEKLHANLRKLGYSSTYASANITRDFRVPGVETRRGIMCPLPHCDNVAKGFYVDFDKETNEFIFNNRKAGTMILSTYDWYGYIPSSLQKADASKGF